MAVLLPPMKEVKSKHSANYANYLFCKIYQELGYSFCIQWTFRLLSSPRHRPASGCSPNWSEWSNWPALISASSKAKCAPHWRKRRAKGRGWVLGIWWGKFVFFMEDMHWNWDRICEKTWIRSWSRSGWMLYLDIFRDYTLNSGVSLFLANLVFPTWIQKYFLKLFVMQKINLLGKRRAPWNNPSEAFNKPSAKGQQKFESGGVRTSRKGRRRGKRDDDEYEEDGGRGKEGGSAEYNEEHTEAGGQCESRGMPFLVGKLIVTGPKSHPK